MPFVFLATPDAIALTTIIEFFASWLDTDIDYARVRLPFYGETYNVDDLRTDTTRLVKVLNTIQI